MITLCFSNKKEFHNWLKTNHTQKESVWLEFRKDKTLPFTPDEALEEALCFGWIDSLIKRIDDNSYIKKFSPRNEKSVWSERNKQIVAKLIEKGLMRPEGMRLIDAAKKNGEWDKEKQGFNNELILKLEEVLEEDKECMILFGKLAASQKKIFSLLYADAKKEQTRINRLEKIKECLRNGKMPM